MGKDGLSTQVEAHGYSWPLLPSDKHSLGYAREAFTSSRARGRWADLRFYLFEWDIPMAAAR